MNSCLDWVAISSSPEMKYGAKPSRRPIVPIVYRTVVEITMPAQIKAFLKDNMIPKTYKAVLTASSHGGKGIEGQVGKQNQIGVDPGHEERSNQKRQKNPYSHSCEMDPLLAAWQEIVLEDCIGRHGISFQV